MRFSETPNQYIEDIEKTRQVLTSPRPLNILVCSHSNATLSLLRTMLNGFSVKTVQDLDEAQQFLQSYPTLNPAVDFVILDDQSEAHADDLARYLHSLGFQAFAETKIIHLYTPTTSSSGNALFANSTIPGVVKMTKPPRQARLLQTLASLKNLPYPSIYHPSSDVSKAMEDIASAQRTLYGNVLIAEGVCCNFSLISISSIGNRQPDSSESTRETTSAIPPFCCGHK